MTDLTPDRWRRVSPELDRALELAVDERGDWLAALRKADPALAAEVEALLDEHEALTSERFLEEGLPPLSVRLRQGQGCR